MLYCSFFQASVTATALLLAGAALASPFPDHHAPHHPAPHQAHPAGYGHPETKYKEEPVPAHYAFEYGVHDEYSGTNFGQNEKRDGYATSGSYTVLLPDGRTQTVTYHVDDAYSGYVADVSYSGEPHYGPGLVDAHHGKGPAHPAPHHAAPHHASPAYHGAAPAPHQAAPHHAAPHHAGPVYHSAAPAPHAPIYHALL